MIDDNEARRKVIEETVTMNVDGVEVPLKEFREIRDNPNIRLKEIAPCVYITLQKLKG